MNTDLKPGTALQKTQPYTPSCRKACTQNHKQALQRQAGRQTLADKTPQSPGEPSKFTKTFPTWAAKVAALLPHGRT